MKKALSLLFLITFYGLSTFAQSTWKVSQSCTYYPEELVLKLDDEIREPLAQELRSHIQNCPELKSIVIRLNSPGGGLGETKSIVAILDQVKAGGIQVITRVSNGDECDSNCIPLFAQGDRREAGEVAAFMFHGVAFYALSNIPNAHDTEEMLVMIRRAVRAEWLASLQAEGVFSLPGMYWMSGKELFEESSGLVTDLLPRHEKHKPYDRSYRRL